jgi:hypothetical protein
MNPRRLYFCRAFEAALFFGGVCTYIADAKHVMIECIVYKQRLYMWETGKIGRGYLRVNLSLA